MYNTSCDALGCRPKLLDEIVMEMRDNLKAHRFVRGLEPNNANNEN